MYNLFFVLFSHLTTSTSILDDHIADDYCATQRLCQSHSKSMPSSNSTLTVDAKSEFRAIDGKMVLILSCSIFVFTRRSKSAFHLISSVKHTSLLSNYEFHSFLMYPQTRNIWPKFIFIFVRKCNEFSVRNKSESNGEEEMKKPRKCEMSARN